MSEGANPRDELREGILAALGKADKPVTFKALVKAVKARAEIVREALAPAVEAGVVYRWPDRRRSQYFWRISPEERARETILKLAAGEALSKSALIKATAKNGLPPKLVESVVTALRAGNQLREVPGFGGSSKLLVRQGAQDAYFKAARSFMEAKIAKAGFDPAAFFTQVSSPHDEPTAAQADAAALILEAVRSLEPVRGVPVSTLRLRNHIPNLAKREFDAAALELRKRQEVFLSQHADPYNISQADKDLLIDGQDGTYYVAIAIR